MIKRFKVYIMDLEGVITYLINCNNATSAQHIAEGLFPNHRVIDVVEA